MVKYYGPLKKASYLVLLTLFFGGIFYIKDNYEKSNPKYFNERQKIDSTYEIKMDSLKKSLVFKKDSLNNSYRSRINFFEKERQRKIEDLEKKLLR